MTKFKYVTEFEFNASAKMLFQYLSTPTALKDWFADKVEMDEDKNYIIYWDGVPRHAKVSSKRTNSHIKFQFFDPNGQEDRNPNYIEFKIEASEITQTTFLKIIDYSEMDDVVELEELWHYMIGKLKEVIGG